METRLSYKNINHYLFDTCICEKRELKNISTQYIELDNFYKQEKNFPSVINIYLGSIVATLHRDSLNNQEYYEFISKNNHGKYYQNYEDYAQILNIIEPKSFSHFTKESINFFSSYHRHESFTSAVAELTLNKHSCCLTHNALKLNNILISKNWEELISRTEQSNESIIKLINCENWIWGDPAFDVGTVIASYLLIWLNSLIVHPAIDLQKSLQMATIPLELLQPSIVALTKAYLSSFPKILDEYPNFLARVIQFIGLGLLHEIVEISQCQKNFNNRGLCILQVAKSLLCRPEQSFNAVFGMAESEITNLTNLEPASIK